MILREGFPPRPSGAPPAFCYDDDHNVLMALITLRVMLCSRHFLPFRRSEWASTWCTKQATDAEAHPSTHCACTRCACRRLIFLAALCEHSIGANCRHSTASYLHQCCSFEGSWWLKRCSSVGQILNSDSGSWLRSQACLLCEQRRTTQ